MMLLGVASVQLWPLAAVKSDGIYDGTLTRQQVINSIEAGSNTLFTLVGGKRAEIGVVDGPNGKYVRTHADGYWNDNLLALTECG
jgi:hypothetical protein